jgi:hypothetical protein
MMLERFEDLRGQTLVRVENVENRELIFTLNTGVQYKLYHLQDCCESVTIEDINGDLMDLIGSVILIAEEATSNTDPEDVKMSEYRDYSFTWTFYRLATAKGFVIIRWYGESNGYYSESVDWSRVTD